MLFLSINQSIYSSQPNTQVQNNYDNIYETIVWRDGYSTQGTDAPLVQATHVLKTNSTHIIVIFLIVFISSLYRVLFISFGAEGSARTSRDSRSTMLFNSETSNGMYVGGVVALLVGHRTCDWQVAGSNPDWAPPQPWDSVTKQYNLLSAKWRLRSAAGTVTVGLASHWPCVTHAAFWTTATAEECARLIH